MNKAELVKHVATETGLTQAQAERALNSVVGGIRQALCYDKRLTLMGFGTFQTTDRKGRTGVNPQTGKPIEIPAKKVVKFKPGKDLTDLLNG